jgi:predicted O-methyltransferase YrrM
MEDYPPLVARAMAQARDQGFPLSRDEAGSGPSSLLPGAGRFLAMLAAGCAGGGIAELGTGAGVGAAWIASAMPADCTLVTVEIDPVLAAAARGLFTGDPRVEVVTGDAVAVIPGRGPFDLVFPDGGRLPYPELVDLLRAGGRLVMDDVTPRETLPPDSPFRDHDDKRDFFFGDPRLLPVEVVLHDLRNSLLVATRVRLPRSGRARRPPAASSQRPMPAPPAVTPAIACQLWNTCDSANPASRYPGCAWGP